MVAVYNMQFSKILKMSQTFKAIHALSHKQEIKL